MPEIFICSDWHFNHDKPFIWEARGFESVEQMNNAIIEKHNALVSHEDDVYVLGDIMLGAKFGLDAGIKLITQMNGRLHFVRGNHDTNNRWQAYNILSNNKINYNQDIVTLENATYLKFDKYNFYLSHYPTITSNNDYNKPLRQRLINLCGHSHTKDKWVDWDKGYIYHVEMDAHDCCPVNIKTILQELQEKVEDELIAVAAGITPHDACVTSPLCLQPYETWQKVEEYKKYKCAKCVYEGYCPGPSWFDVQCPGKMKYHRDPPDGGYYG